jgi:hypothetical protein
MNTEPTPEEIQGAKMIQYLTRLGLDDEEPFERSLMNWRRFTPWEKQQTLAVYNLCGGPKAESAQSEQQVVVE